mmetsp:Transcript_15164/g.24174  ORF Transcript_15164/g.24174 Transcript_15164/m.24174 type:complete len:541 (-) Transcript_15164:296-1918(-)
MPSRQNNKKRERGSTGPVTRRNNNTNKKARKGKKKNKKAQQRPPSPPQGSIFARSGEKLDVKGAKLLEQLRLERAKEAELAQRYPPPIVAADEAAAAEDNDEKNNDEEVDEDFSVFDRIAAAGGSSNNNGGGTTRRNVDAAYNDEEEEEEEEYDDGEEGIDLNGALIRRANGEDELEYQEDNKSDGGKGDEEDDDDEAPDAKGNDGEELINVEFEFFDPKPTDYYSVRTFLRNWIIIHPSSKKQLTTTPRKQSKMVNDDGDDKNKRRTTSSNNSGGEKQSLVSYFDDYDAKWNMASGELADIISKQATVGTMIKAEGSGSSDSENAPLAFITAVNINTHRKASCIQMLGDFLLFKAPNSHKKTFRKIWNQALSGNKQVGLLITERLINLPPTLVPILHAELQKDISWAQKNEDTASLKKSFKFDSFIYVTKAFYPPRNHGDDSDDENHQQQQHKQGMLGEGKKGRGFVWFQFEDEVVSRHATLQFSFKVPAPQTKSLASESSPGGLGSLEREQIVMLIPASKIAKIQQEMSLMLLEDNGL